MQARMDSVFCCTSETFRHNRHQMRHGNGQRNDCDSKRACTIPTEASNAFFTLRLPIFGQRSTYPLGERICSSTSRHVLAGIPRETPASVMAKTRPSWLMKVQNSFKMKSYLRANRKTMGR